MMEYSFDIEYIKGDENVVADSFSLLCLRESAEEGKVATTTNVNAIQSTELTSDESYIPENLFATLERVHDPQVGR